MGDYASSLTNYLKAFLLQGEGSLNAGYGETNWCVN